MNTVSLWFASQFDQNEGNSKSTLHGPVMPVFPRKSKGLYLDEDEEEFELCLRWLLNKCCLFIIHV